MKELLSKIAEALGLDKDSDEDAVLAELAKRHSLDTVAEALDLEGDDVTTEKIVEKIKDLSEDNEGKTLEDRAKDVGKRLVDEDDFSELKRHAAAGKEAADKLHERDFEDAFDDALHDKDGPRVDAKPETKERFRKLYDLDADSTVETLKNLPRIANAKLQGSGEGPDDTPDGVDEDRAKLDKRVKAKMKEKDISYSEALDLVLDEDGEES